MIEVRFHGRGGQGAVTAAELLAQAAQVEGIQNQADRQYDELVWLASKGQAEGGKA